MQKRTGKGFERYQFNSLTELAGFLDTHKRTWSLNSSKTTRPDKAWDLGVDYDKAWDLARNGWLEGAQQIRKALKLLPPATPRPINRNDFYGHMPNVPRFCAGAPDSMIRHGRRATKDMGRVLTIITPINALCFVNATHMSNFGTGLAHYIAELEASGTRVEVIAALANNINGVRVAHSWTVKKADQPLDLPVMAMSIGHPATFRRIGFALLEHTDVPQCPSYGRTVPTELRDIINAPKGAFILNGMAKANEVARTPEAASEYIRKQLQAVLKDREAA